jgi:DNA-binding beta-propeller fold protein YncE
LRWPLLRLPAAILAGLALLLVLCAPASAISQHGHEFAFSFGEAGNGSEQLEHPSGVAFGQQSGDIYVADRDNNRVQVFEPHGAGKPTLVKSISVPYPVAIAVDNSSESSDPSKGDIYVVGITAAELKAKEKEEEEPEVFLVYKFSAKGSLIMKLKKIKYKHKEKAGVEEEEFEEEFEEVKGIAVDSKGTVLVHQGEEIYEFSNATKSKGFAHLEAEGEARPGLAVDGEGNIYAGVDEASEPSSLESELSTVIEAEDELAGILPEEGFAVVTELNSKGEFKVPQLDAEFTTGVAVNPIDEAALGVDERNDVYITNVSPYAGKTATTVAAFNPHHELIQRIEIPHGGAGQYGSGIAVDPKTGTLYVADATADDVEVLELEKAGAPTVGGLTACTLGGGAGCPTAAGAVKLSAQVDPRGNDTKYHFEYGPSACTPQPSTCSSTPEQDAHSGYADVSAVEEITNLPAGTYHYRIVASGKGQASEERTFTIVAAPADALPDGRQWELVSPPEKSGNEPEPMQDVGSTLRAAEAGGAITYAADGPMGTGIEGSRNPEYGQILSIRGQHGWSSRDLTTPHDNGLGVKSLEKPSEYADFSPDLALGLLEPYVGYVHQGQWAEPALAPPVSAHEKELHAEGKEYAEKSIYLRANPPLEPEPGEAADYEQALANGEAMGNPGYLPLVTEESGLGHPFGGGFKVPHNLGVEFALLATPDLSHVVFKSWKASPGMYEWGPGGHIQLIGLLPKAGAVSCAGEACEARPPEGVEPGSWEGRPQRNAISNDGSRIFFTQEGVGTNGHLYVRDTATQETVQLDVPNGVTEPGKPKPRFETASTDGTKVFFTDSQKLTTGSRANGSAPDLYVAELSGGQETPLSVKIVDLTPEGNAGESADVPEASSSGGGVIGASEHGSYVYFVASGALAPGSERASCYAISEGEGTCNLYVRHYNGSEWEPTRLIAVLSGADAATWGEPFNRLGSELPLMSSRVSPNGEWLAFMSERPLTGYDNEDRGSEAPGERLDQEVFIFNAQSGNLVCASCNPTGKRPAGVFDHGQKLPPNAGAGEESEGVGLVADRDEIWNEHWLAGSLPGWTATTTLTSIYQSRYLSNSGRLFFNSPDALVPAVEEEINAGKTSKEKVYEYEPQGLGSCTSASGCIGLISSAGAEHETAFLDASANGNDVFFLSASPLVQADKDQSFDVYDAHVCEAAAPCLPPPAAAEVPCAETRTCRPGTFTGSGYQAPASTGTGSGNGTPTTQVLHEKTGQPPTQKPKPTVAQQLANALKGCKAQKSKGKRTACEKRARAKYRPLLLAEALKACRKDKAKARAACEKAARKKYSAKTATKARRARVGRR